MRDFRRLRTFGLADRLLVELYAETKGLPPEERYGLQSQLRRAALSVPTNIVEGTARRTTREYVQFLRTAFGSAIEVKYLLDVSYRLGLLTSSNAERLKEQYDHLVRMLHDQIDALERAAEQRPGAAVSREP